ncbi:MAG: NAD(P)-dependent oxidoreductase [Nitrososphaerota archaeon]
MEVGIIGLGNMGGKMAHKLKECGINIAGYDTNESLLQTRLKQGDIDNVLTKDEVPRVKFFILSLPSTASISEVLNSYSFSKNTLILDMSTVGINFSRQNHDLMTKKGIRYLDAPVIGMPAGVGTWTIPVGGEEKDFDDAQAILRCLGKNVIYFGPAGSGSAIKVLNNMISLSTWATISEAVVIADSLGVDLSKMYKAIKSSGGGAVSPMLDRIERIVNSDYQNICSVDVNIKDLEAAIELSIITKVPSLMASAALNLHLIAHDRGYGNMDMDAIVLAFDQFKKSHGVK